MARFSIMHAQSPKLSSGDITARLTTFLLALRQKGWIKAQAEVGRPAGSETEEPHDDPHVPPGEAKGVFLPHDDRLIIERRAGRLHKRQLAVSGLNHLNKEDRDRLKALDSGVSLVRIPNEHRADELAAALHAEMPWMSAATEYAWQAMRRSVRQRDIGFRLPPVILDGPPGIGKTRWATRLTELVGAHGTVVDATGEAASFSVVGCQRGWSNARPGRLLELILAKLSGNPVLVIDELEKAGRVTSDKGVPFGLSEGLLPLLERSTATNWSCPFYCVGFDLSYVSWILLSNNLALLPEPLLSRCNVIRLKEVPVTDLIGFAKREGLDRELSEASIAAIIDALAAVSPSVRPQPSLRTVQRMLDLAVDLENKQRPM